MKRAIWIVLMALGANCLTTPASAQSSRVQETFSQADRALAEQILLRQQQVAEAEAAVSELSTQLALARVNRQSSGYITLKRVFLVGAVVSASALIYGLSKTEVKGQLIALPVFGRGTFVGLFGLVANGVGYMVTDATEITLSHVDDTKLSVDLRAAQLELAALKKSLERLKAKTAQ